MFRPMALTVIFALTGSLLLSLTATPVLASFFLRPGMSERDTLPVRWAKRVYEPVLAVGPAAPGGRRARRRWRVRARASRSRSGSAASSSRSSTRAT